MLSPQNCRPKASHVLAYVTLCDNMGSTLPRPYLAHCGLRGHSCPQVHTGRHQAQLCQLLLTGPKTQAEATVALGVSHGWV